MNGLTDEWMNWSFASDSLMIKNLNKVFFVGWMDEWINEKKSGPLKNSLDEWINGWMDELIFCFRFSNDQKSQQSNFCWINGWMD